MHTALKDASEMLMANRVQEFTQAWWDAKVYRPDGIIAGADTWEALVNKRQVKSVPYPWDGLNEITRGHRPYELVTITSGSGMGKSQFIRELEYDLLQRTDANIGVLALEEDVATTALGIMSVASSRRLHLEEDTPVDELRPHWEATMGSGRYYLFDHWGSTSADELLSRVRHMAKACDCRYIILDHLSIVVSSQENGDERKAIDEIMTKLRTLVAETGITLFLVSHLKRSSGTAHEDGGRISLQDLRGSSVDCSVVRHRYRHGAKPTTRGRGREEHYVCPGSQESLRRGNRTRLLATVRQVYRTYPRVRQP